MSKKSREKLEKKVDNMEMYSVVMKDLYSKSIFQRGTVSIPVIPTKSATDSSIHPTGPLHPAYRITPITPFTPIPSTTPPPAVTIQEPLGKTKDEQYLEKLERIAKALETIVERFC